MHAAGQRAHAALAKARRRIAEALQTESSGVIFTSGGTESINQAIRSAAQIGEDRGHRHIVSTAFEHHTVLHALDALRERGYEVTLVRPQQDGLISVADIENAIRPDTCLVSVMAANNEIGTIQPVAQIGELCRDRRIPFHCDAVQAVGHIPVSLALQNIDYLSLSAHKFHGPLGIGALCTKRGASLSRILEGGGQERGYRPGTENVPGAIGMVEALCESIENMENNAQRIATLRDRVIAGISAIPGAHLTGHPTRRLPGNVHFTFEYVESEPLLVMLDGRGICVSAGSACTSGALTQSHVLQALGIPRNRAALRITLDTDNSEDDAEAIVRNVRECVEVLRGGCP